MGFKNYWNELKRRNVIKAAIAYLVVAWLITQVLSIILPAFEAPSYVLKIALVILLIGFPIWIVFYGFMNLLQMELGKLKILSQRSR